MKKITVLLGLIFILGIVVPSFIFAGNVSSDDIVDGEVMTVDIADGAVTDAKISGTISATKIEQGSGSGLDADTLDGLDSTSFAPAIVETANIADGAITNVKIPDNEITAAKIADGEDSGLNADMLDGFESSEFSKKYANVVVVAKSGGDFDTIQAAIDSVNPTYDNQVLIKIMSGRYNGRIILKSYVHLKGSSRSSTIIENTSGGSPIDAISLSDISIKDLSIDASAHGYGIQCPSSSITIERVSISGASQTGIQGLTAAISIKDSSFSGNTTGVQITSGDVIGNSFSENVTALVTNSGMHKITGNSFSNNDTGISATGSGDGPLISNNSFSRNNTVGINVAGGVPFITGNLFYYNYGYAISVNYSGANIIGNVMKWNSGGIQLNNLNSNAGWITVVSGNKLRENGGCSISIVDSSSNINNNVLTPNTGFCMDALSNPNISFNIVDNISGDTWSGAYNVKTDGTPW